MLCCRTLTFKELLYKLATLHCKNLHSKIGTTALYIGLYIHFEKDAFKIKLNSVCPQRDNGPEYRHNALQCAFCIYIIPFIIT